MSNLSFKGYVISENFDPKKDPVSQFKPQDLTPKKFEEYDVDIKVNVCGVCSSDVHTVTGGWGEFIAPLCSGHEVAGVVDRVGDKVTEFKKGDRVGVGAQVCSCFKCKACKSEREQYCPNGVDTYNAKYPNGDVAHGGYSSAIRVHERFTFKIPEGLADEDAAPMMCGGLTVYNPLKRYETGPGKKVAIVGIGGLGHFAVQFAAAMGAEVTAFTHQSDKEADCKKMGAHQVVNTTKKGFAEDYATYFDLVLSTVDDAAGLPLAELLSMVDIEGHFHSVGLPNSSIPELKFQSMAGNGCAISVSHIGSKKEANEMLALAAKKGVTTWKQVLPMSQAGQAILNVHENKVRYRHVLKCDL